MDADDREQYIRDRERGISQTPEPEPFPAPHQPPECLKRLVVAAWRPSSAKHFRRLSRFHQRAYRGGR